MRIARPANEVWELASKTGSSRESKVYGFFKVAVIEGPTVGIDMVKEGLDY